MQTNTNDAAKRSNKTFYIGEVLDVLDPTKIGRVRVSIFDYEGEDGDNGLWTMVMQPTANDGKNGVFQKLQKGTWVVVVFVDAPSNQMPMIIGTISSKREDVFEAPKVFRGEQTLSLKMEEKGVDEERRLNDRTVIFQKGNSVYLEDDRVVISHKSGSYITFDEEGGINIYARKIRMKSEESVEMMIKNTATKIIDGAIELKAKVLKIFD